MGSTDLRPRRRPGDRGQTSVEFAGTFPLMLLVLIVLWQCVLVGYTFALAGNAADKAVRAGAAADRGAGGGAAQACERAGREDLPDAWRGAAIGCRPEGDLVRAEVAIRVPVLFPGGPRLPITVRGESAAARESRR
jgi:pilus assembly protein CpaE